MAHAPLIQLRCQAVRIVVGLLQSALPTRQMRGGRVIAAISRGSAMSKLIKEKIRLLFAMMVLTLTITVLTSGWVLYDLLGQIGQETARGVAFTTQLLDEERLIQVNFKRQVQEWKDLLLRGDDEADYRRYLDAFRTQASKVQEQMSHLSGELKHQGMANDHLLGLQQTHAELTRQYEQALLQYPLLGQPENMAKLDESVRGMDRALSAELDVLGDETRVEALARAASVTDLVMANHELHEYFIYAVLLVLIPGVGYGCMFWLNKLTRQILLEKERVQVTLASIGDAVVVTDRHGNVEYLNPVAEMMTGWSLDDAKEKPLQDVFRIINEQTRQLVENPVEVVLREGRIVGLANHTVLIARDDRECAIEDSAAPVRDLSGAIRGVVLVFHDATAARTAADALQREKAVFRATFEQAAVGVVHIDPASLTIFRTNPRFQELLGYTEDELFGMSVGEFTLPEDRGDFLAALANLLGGEIEAIRGEKRCPRKDGSIGWSNLSLSLIRMDDGSPDFLVAVLEDITARKQAEDELRRVRAQYQTLFDQMPDAVLLVDLEGRVTGFNQEALRQYEYTPEEMLRLTVPDLEAKESPQEHIEHRQNIAATGRDDFETRHRTKYGRIVDVQAAVRLITMADGKPMFQAAFRDISSQKHAHERIEFLANHDHLTSLPNRRLLRDRVERAIGNADRHGSRVALLFLDLDHFKVINDTLGHEVGDLLLQAVADRLRGCVRDQDTIARIGGDEFVVILVDLPNSEAVGNVAQKIVDTLSSPYLAGGYDLHTSPSIGISLYPDDANSFDALMQQADAAMYHTKENGRSGYRFYSAEINLQTQERLAIEHDLHKALERDEFELYYQPKVDSRNGELIGAEALIRWKHPERGMVSPGQFIPVAEQSNLINGIGEWVVRTVCGQSRAWSDAGLCAVPISFNVSARQFLYSDLPVVLAHAIELTGADPTLLEMELTESVLMRPQDVQAALATIKAMGFRIALDDFGTGYSSLAYLRKMEIDTIKIDRTFVNDLETNADDVIVVQTLIATALNLKMDVIAEGVETAGQAKILCDSGCCACQGYYFGKPMPVAQFAALLRSA